MQGLYPSSLPKEYQGVVIYAYGDNDPRVVPMNGAPGQLYLQLTSGILYRKMDSGDNTNWQPVNDAIRIDNGAIINVSLIESVLISTAASTVNLPIAPDNFKLTVKAVLGATIVPFLGDDIDGDPNLVLAAGRAVTLIKNGTTWYAISNY